jgi:hypothetical protein
VKEEVKVQVSENIHEFEGFLLNLSLESFHLISKMYKPEVLPVVSCVGVKLGISFDKKKRIHRLRVFQVMKPRAMK